MTKRQALKMAREIVSEHRRRHNVMAGHYWPELAKKFTAALVAVAATTEKSK